MVLGHKLTWDHCTEYIQKKGNKGLVFFKSWFHLMLTTKCFRCSIVPMLKVFNFQHCMLVRHHNSSTKTPSVTTASKLQGIDLQDIYRFRALNQAERILSESRHPLFIAFELLPSGRRYHFPAFYRNRTKQSFRLQAISFLNIWMVTSGLDCLLCLFSVPKQWLFIYLFFVCLFMCLFIYFVVVLASYKTVSQCTHPRYLRNLNE